MKTVPNAQPPITRCQAGFTSKKGFVADPIAFSPAAIARVPAATPSMMRHEPTPVPTSSAAPARQASTEVSPMEPGTKPTSACLQSKSAAISAVPPRVATASAVAPLTASVDVSAAIQTASPDIAAG